METGGGSCSLPKELRFLQNWRGGITGIGIYLLLPAILFIAAFFLAFGNPSYGAVLTLKTIGAVAPVMNPLWCIPLAYGAGARFLFR